MRADIRYNNIIDSDEARIAQAAADAAPGLPASEINADRFYITQNYARYTRENHDVCEMFDRRWSVLEQQVSGQFIEGMRILRLTRDRIPLLDDLTLEQDLTIAGGAVLPKGTRLDGINKFLQAQSSWGSHAVPGYLPAKAFFACLAQRPEFPTTVLIRPRETMDYLPEPDIFHDVFGHVPLHTLRVFADFLQTYGKAALLCEDEEHIKRLGRLFWFTVEFGLIRENGKIKVYGSGLVSSHSEAEYSLHGAWETKGRPAPDCTPRNMPEYRPFDMDRICETDFEIDHFQPIYYVLESFEQLRDAMNEYAEEVIGEAGMAKMAAGR